ncbi:MAG: DNA polymerase III subunit epsilon [Maribacter sp.]|nr:MAG: DNA polymerase III subunit epsilon [Maribacter sp.]
MQEPVLKFYDDTGLEAELAALKKSDNHKVLRRIIFPQITQIDITKLPEYNDFTIHRGIYLDTETTGLLHEVDEVIQLCMLPFIYGKDPNSTNAIIFGVYEPYIGFQEPTEPLAPIITDITGITIEMLAGQSLDIKKIENYLEKSEIVIAHNAAFDRPFTHAISPAFSEKNWACSFADIKWNEQGFESRKLGHLAADFGFYFDAHRADADCYAGLAILLQINDEGISYFQQLLENSKKDSVTLRAQLAPFEKKDELKERGYIWKDGSDGVAKGWEIVVSEDYVDEEKSWLTETIYNNNPKFLEKTQTALGSVRKIV